jgi:hypothetical protein
VRFAYTTDGTARRGPVTFRGVDLDRLRDSLGDHPALAAALGLVGRQRRLARRGSGQDERPLDEQTDGRSR